VAAQESTNRSKAAEKRKKVRKKAAARSTKRAKPNDAENGYDDKPVEEVVENPVNANEGLISKKINVLLVLAKRERAFNRKRRWFRVYHSSLIAPRSQRSTLTRRKTMRRRRRRRLMRRNMRSRRTPYRIQVTTGRRKPSMTTTLQIWNSRICRHLHQRGTTAETVVGDTANIKKK
jgi:hypothetical protein